MSARAPRRRFASPFVVTLAAIPAVGACNPPPPQRPVQPEPAVMQEPAPTPTEQPAPATNEPVVASPDEPEPADKGEPAKVEMIWTVTKVKGAADCQAFLDTSCPKVDPGKPMPTCNPPPPTKYACPPNLADGGSIKIILRAGATECFQKYEPIKCPQGAKCNPPPPRKLACPSR
jgi:hypothetical protein